MNALLKISFLLLLQLPASATMAGLSGCNMSPVLNNPNKYQICFGDNTCSTFSCGPGRVLSLSECGCVRRPGVNDINKPVGSGANTLDKPTPFDHTDQLLSTPVPGTSNPFFEEHPGFLPKDCVTFKPHPSSSFMYVEETITGNVSRDCPPGTYFSELVCRCIIDTNSPAAMDSSSSRWSHSGSRSCMAKYLQCIQSPRELEDNISDTPAPTCLPEVYISAQTNLESAGSYGQISVENNKVLLKNDKAEFDGSAYLRIDFYNGNEFSRGLTVAMVVEEAAPNIPGRQVLLSNCIGSVAPSVDIYMDAALGAVVFQIDVSAQELINVTVPYTRGVPKRLVMIYDGSTLTGQVDTEQRTVDIKGTIEGRHQALFIGNSACGSNLGFHGFLDEIRLYRCAQRNILNTF